MAPPKAEPPRIEATVTMAAVVGAHGVGGEVRLKIFADSLDEYRSFNDGTLKLTSLRNGSNGAIARFAGVADRSAAEALRGTALTVPRSTLPPLADGEYYHADLIGLPAVTPDGESLGSVVAVDNFGAGDVIEVERPTGKRFMVPMRPEAVPDWSAERIIIEPAFAD